MEIVESSSPPIDLSPGAPDDGWGDDLDSDDDLSLAEIAENEGITRQGVRDAIKRAEAQLFEMEEKLGFVKRFSDMNDGLGRISGCVDKIKDYNMHYGLSREINDNVAEIRAILAQLNS